MRLHAPTAIVVCAAATLLGCGSDTPGDAADTAIAADTTPGADALACPPGVSQSWCPGPTTIVVCNAEGSAWVESECPYPQTCFSGRCVDYACSPGAVRCSDPRTRSACLADGAGSFAWVDVEDCSGLCQEGACVGACGFDVKQGIAEDCEHFVVNLSGAPDNACERSRLLAVPSSEADAIAVFDVSQDPPVLLDGSPFPTCDDPSRIMIDASTDVIATCRGDGRVNRHAADGTLRWSRALPDCNAVRGVVSGPDGRLFAGCTTTTRLHELHPDTGELLDAITTGVQVYGLAIDQTGVYVTDFGVLAKVHVLGGMNIVWKVPANGYGIAADQEGVIWLAEAPGLVAYDARDGSIIDTVSVLAAGEDLGGYCNGVAVARDGTVYAGCGESGDFVVAYDPGRDDLDVLWLPEGQRHPRGVAVDPDGNVYTINLESDDCTRFDAVTRATRAFGGGGALVGPYGYSGDMTALNACIFSGKVTWTSPLLDFGDDATRWLTIRYRTEEPAGTSVTVRYRLDDGPWVRIASGMDIDATARTLQVQAELESTVPDAAPTLSELAVFYEL